MRKLILGLLQNSSFPIFYGRKIAAASKLFIWKKQKPKGIAIGIFISVMLSMIITVGIYGEDGLQTVDEQVDKMDIDGLNAILKSSEYTEEFDFSGMLKKAVRGEINISPGELLNIMLRQFFNEVFAHTALMRNLIIICILSAVLKNLSSSFSKKSVGEMGFYISYIVIIIILFESFTLGVSIVADTTEFLVQIMHAALPVIIGLLAMSGGVTSAYVFHPLVFFSVEFISSVIKSLLIPLLIIGTALQIINYLTERNILTKFAELIKKVISWALKGSAIFFVFTLSLQRVGTVAVNSAVHKTAKSAVNLVPVVGQVMTGAVDTVMYWSQVIKSGFLVTTVILILIACFVPFVKIVAMIFVYKFTAAIIQPICDERITECIDSIGMFSALLLGVLGTVIFMFVFCIMIMLTTAVN